MLQFFLVKESDCFAAIAAYIHSPAYFSHTETQSLRRHISTQESSFSSSISKASYEERRTNKLFFVCFVGVYLGVFAAIIYVAKFLFLWILMSFQEMGLTQNH